MARETYMDWSVNNIKKTTGISFLTGSIYKGQRKIFGCEKCIYNSGEHTCSLSQVVEELKIDSADAMKLSGN